MKRRLFGTTATFFKQRWLDQLRAPANLGALSNTALCETTIDSRESLLIAALRKSPLSFGTRQMAVGDIELVAHSSSHRVLIERKSVEDLYSSVKTGRLLDQLSRLFEHRRKDDEKCIVVLVLEGHLAAGVTPHGIYQTVTTAYTSLLLRDRLSVVRTDSVEETARWVTQLASGEKLRALFQPASEFSNLVVRRPAPCGRKISGVHLPYLKLLMAIRGVSGNRAEAIAKKFPTLEILLTEIRARGTQTLSQLVASSNARSTGSPIGAATALHIVEALLGPSDPLVAQFKLAKHILATTNMSASAAHALAKQFGSISSLRAIFLRDPQSVPPELVPDLAALVEEPEPLLTGLKGVKGVSAKTAETLTEHFKNVKNLHTIFLHMHHLEAINYLRMLGPGRMIARPAVENVLMWCETEGFFVKSAELK